jgi:antitoxin (DNA-binding transcriptional repressor) of toxin-antitoxin stability system
VSVNLSVTEFVRSFSDFINRVAYRGEGFVLTRGGRPVGELRPLPQSRRLGDLPAILASLPQLDAVEVAAFSDDLEAARREVDARPLDDRWAS